MNQKEFKKLRTICQKGWKEIAKSGERSTKFEKFSCGCPACEISKRTSYKILKNTPYQVPYYDCKFCPIDKWRLLEETATMARCELPGQEYIQWIQQEGEEKVNAALKISKLEWSYLPEYKNINVKDLLEDIK